MWGAFKVFVLILGAAPAACGAGWGRGGMCGRLLEDASKASSGKLAAGGAIDLSTPVDFGEGVPVMHSEFGMRILVKIEKRADGMVLLLRHPTDRKTRSPAIEILTATHAPRIARLGTEDAYRIIEARITRFLSERGSEESRIAFAMATYRLLLDHKAPQMKRHDESIWKQFCAKKGISGVDFMEQVESWAEQHAFFMAAVGRPLAQFENPISLAEFITFVSDESGENLVHSGTLRFAHYEPHVNVGVGIATTFTGGALGRPGHPLHHYGSPFLVPHDVYVNLLTQGWRQGERFVSRERPLDFAFSAYRHADKDVEGTDTNLVYKFKESDDAAGTLSLVSPLIDREADRFAAFVRAGVPRDTPRFIVVPMSSSQTGQPKSTMISLSLRLAHFVREKGELTGVVHDGRQRPQRAQPSLFQRIVNAEKIGAVSRGADWEGATVLLVDDVYTTGATVAQAKAICFESGAARVLVVTLSRSSLDDLILDVASTSIMPGAKPKARAGDGEDRVLPKRRRLVTASEVTDYLNQEPEVRRQNLVDEARAWQLAIATAENGEPGNAYGVLNLLKREEDLKAVLVQANLIRPRARPRPDLTYDVEFFTRQFDLIANRRGPDLTLGALTPYERLVIEVIQQFEAMQQPLGAYPNALSIPARKLRKRLAEL